MPVRRREREHRGCSSGRARKRIFATASALLTTVLVAGCALLAPEAGKSTPTYDATVTVKTSAPALGDISGDYIGLSFDSGALSSGAFNAEGNLPRLLKNLGTSVMRFGADGVDTAYTGISASNLQALASLARASGWSVLFSEDLGHFSAPEVSADAKAVSAALGGSLYAFACGNEPDQYHANGIRSSSYSLSQYLTQVGKCYDAIRAGAPGALLEGPDQAGHEQYWLKGYAAAETGKVAYLGVHAYPLGCGPSVQEKPGAELAGSLLSPGLAAAEAKWISESVAVAKTMGAQAWMTETNSMCDGGASTVSHSYASALWAIDYILTGAENGLEGMNFHGGVSADCDSYTPLCQTSTNEYAPNPVYYGLLFAHLLGSGDLLPVDVSARSDAANVTAFALRPSSGGGLRLMVENLSAENSSTTLRVGGDPSAATALTLTGPSLLATGGVNIQGATVAANGSFTPGEPTALTCASHACHILLAPYTAALITIG
jgi:hypothetical protein